jgi:hypothetical protein
MGTDPVIHFPEYRAYEAARIEVNDACIALHLSTRIALVHLDGLPRGDGRLSDLLRIPEAAYLDLPVTGVTERLLTAERHFACMAIPYVLTVYEEFCKSLLLLAQHRAQDPKDLAARVPTLRLSELHSALEQTLGIVLDSANVELFEFSRMVRNRIVHHGATVGSNLRRDWFAIPESSRNRWENWAKRPPTFGKSASPLDLGVGEVISVLAVSKRLAREACSKFSSCLSVADWCNIIVGEVAATDPQRWGQRSTRLRRVVGRARTHYGPLSLAEGDLGRVSDVERCFTSMIG